MSKVSDVLTVINSLPARFGFRQKARHAYRPSSVEFWYRELWHLFGGIVVCAAALSFGGVGHGVTFAVLVVAQTVKEIRENTTYRQGWLHTTIDVFAWTAGGAITFLPSFWIIEITSSAVAIMVIKTEIAGDNRNDDERRAWRHLIGKDAP